MERLESNSRQMIVADEITLMTDTRRWKCRYCDGMMNGVMETAVKEHFETFHPEVVALAMLRDLPKMAIVVRNTGDWSVPQRAMAYVNFEHYNRWYSLAVPYLGKKA